MSSERNKILSLYEASNRSTTHKITSRIFWKREIKGKLILVQAYFGKYLAISDSKTEVSVPSAETNQIEN